VSSSALFDPARHEALDTGLAWSEARAREAIQASVRDAEQARAPVSRACTSAVPA
jgi:hypothetical protein